MVLPLSGIIDAPKLCGGKPSHAHATQQMQESTSSTVDKVVFVEREAEIAYFLRKRRDLTCINSSFTSNSSIRLPIWHRRRRRMGRAPASVVLSASNKQQLSKRRSLHSRRQLVGWATFVFCLTAIGMLSRMQTMSREIEINLSSNTATSRTSDVQNHHSRLRQKKICFLQSVFGEPSLPSLDRPYNVTLLRKENPLYEFYYFTNMPQLETPGWTKILMEDREFLGKNIQRHITMSRQPKFLGWKIHEPIREKCRLVIYMDGHFHPRSGKGNKFDRIAQSVERSQFGLIHTTHPKGGTLTREFERIVSGTKDTQEHVDASLKWLQAQPDWNNNATLYWNAVFAYDPSNPYYRKASEFFWDRYKQELDSWRDQPLWAYTLHHFGIEPLTMRHDTLHSFILEDFDLKGDHHYGEHSVTHAKKEV